MYLTYSSMKAIRSFSWSLGNCPDAPLLAMPSLSFIHMNEATVSTVAPCGKYDDCCRYLLSERIISVTPRR